MIAGLQFVIETGQFEHVRFTGDALRIKQIIINLLSNAFKFTMEGGRVLFRTEEIPAKEENHVRYCFTVQDSGIGMSEEFLKRLFEPFIRSDKVSRVEGTGLGLSITKGLVELMGGTIRVESWLQKGTRFELELEFEAVVSYDFNIAEKEIINYSVTRRLINGSKQKTCKEKSSKKIKGSSESGGCCGRNE